MSEAMYKIKDLSEDEFIFITAFMKEIKNLISKISAMTQEERLAWYEKFQYPRPINFQKKIEGTVYSVNSHFNQKSNEPFSLRTSLSTPETMQARLSLKQAPRLNQ